MRSVIFSPVAVVMALLLVAPAGAQPRAPRPDTVPVPAVDPLRGDRNALSGLAAQARQQQDVFERNHRQGLRFYNGGADARCDVDFGGNLCYWNNNGDVPPPDERNDAKIERLELLRTLAQAQAANPADDWVSGMRVRYALEAGQLDTAARAASACAGTAWWCAALQGLAAHVANRHQAASAAFARALAAMPDAQRCTWTDLSWWLEPVSQPAYQAIACAARASAISCSGMAWPKEMVADFTMPPQAVQAGALPVRSISSATQSISWRSPQDRHFA